MNHEAIFADMPIIIHALRDVTRVIVIFGTVFAEGTSRSEIPCKTRLSGFQK